MNTRILAVVVGAIGLAAVTFLVFSGTIRYGYLNWDDDIYVRDNEMIRSLSAENITWFFSNSYYYSYIPVTMVSYAVEYALWQQSPAGYHLSNAILHSMNAAWIALLFLALMGRGGSGNPQTEAEKPDDWWGAKVVGAFVAALLFSIHPLRAESVAWISDRKDLLCTFFFLPATLMYLKFSRVREGKRPFLALSCSFALFLLAALSKTIAVSFPVVLVLLDWMDGRKLSDSAKSLAREKLPFVIASIILAGTALLISPGGKKAYAVGQLEGIDVVLYPFYSSVFYLWKTIVPVNLSPLYPSVETSALLLSLVCFALIAAGSLYAASKGQKVFLVALLAYLACIGPTVIGLSSGMQPQADRYSYLATIPFFLLFGAGVSVVWWQLSRSGKFVLVVSAGLLLTVLTLHTLRVTGHWESSETLWKYVVESSPPERDYLDAYINLGEEYATNWELAEAEDILNSAIAIDSTSRDAFYNLAHVLYLRGMWEEAADLFKKSTDLDSTYARGFFNYAVVESQLGRDELAIPAMRRAAHLGMKAAEDALAASGIPLDAEDETTIPLDRK